MPKKGDGGVTVVCDTCGKHHVRSPSLVLGRKQHYCSRRCRGLSEAGKGNPNWRGGADRTCLRCGTTFIGYPISGHRKYCSIVCKADALRGKPKEPKNRKYKRVEDFGEAVVAVRPEFAPTDHFRPVIGFPGYFVRADGVILGATGTPMSARKLNANGYPCVFLWSGTRHRCLTAHTVVCRAWHGPKPSPNHIVAHWDGDRTNFRPENLRWATHQENMDDRVRHQRIGRRLRERDVREIRVASGLEIPVSALAASYGVYPSTIYDILQGRTWKRLAA